MINRAVEGTLSASRHLWEWSQRHERTGAVARFLRAHALEVIAVLCLVGLVIAVDPAKLGTVFGRLEIRPLVLMIPVTLGMYLLRSVGWWVTLREIGVKVDLPHSIAVEFAGQTMIFMPTGDLARVKLIKDVTGTSRSGGELTATIAFQELIFIFVMGLGVVPRIAKQPDIGLLVLVMVLFQALILTVLIWEPAYRWAIRTVERVKILRRFDKQLRSIRPAFIELLHPRTAVPVVICNMVAVALTYLLFYLSLQAIGQHQVSFIAAAFVLALSHILSGLSLIPGGVGPFEGLLTVLMIANGVPPASGAAAGLLYRGFNDILMAGVGAVFLVLIRRGKLQFRRRTSRRATASAATSTPATRRGKS